MSYRNTGSSDEHTAAKTEWNEMNTEAEAEKYKKALWR